MKRLRRLISLLVVFCMATSMLPAAVYAKEISQTIEIADNTGSELGKFDSPVKEGTFNGNFYQVWDNSMTWSEAEAYCKNLGGHLVTITSEEEQTFIEDLLAEGCNKKQYWIGLRYIDGSHQWVTNEPLEFTNWDNGEPNFSKSSNGDEFEKYVHILNLPNPNIKHPSGSIQYGWNDMFEDNVFPGEEEFFNDCYVGFICEFEKTSSTSIKNGTFEYLSYDNQIREYTYHYDESWFWKSSYNYQHDLTRMSLRVAMAAGDIRAADGQADADGARPLKNLMRDLGFAYSEEYSHYPIPEYDSIGYGIGSKTITSSSGEKCTLIMVAVRGSGYGVEWGGNFRVSAGIDHEGFRLAADQVVDGIRKYIAANETQFQPTVKIWISGYSRAAATANLVASDLDDGFIEQLEPDNVFAFCFECPQNTTNNQASNTEYDNIVNIVNPIDLVPKVAMSAWGFRRFGMTYYLPSAETTAFYSSKSAAMQLKYRSMLSYASDAGLSDEELDALVLDISREEPGQASALDDLFDAVAGMLISSSHYTEHYQNVTIPAVAEALGQGINFSNLGSVLQPFPVLLSPAINLLAQYKLMDGHDLTAIGLNAHYMELCLAWLDSLDGVYRNDYSSVCRRVFINCPVNVAVYDSNIRLVASISDDVVADIEDGIGAYIDSRGQKVIVLPTDDEYTIQLTATDNGTMTYTVTEYDLDSGSDLKVVSYYEVAISEGDKLYGTAENLTNVSEARYSLISTGGEPINPTITQTGSEVKTYTVDVLTADGGTVFGGGIFTNGEFAKVVATPDEEYMFDGWYMGDHLVSKNLEYRFLVDDNVTISAMFVEKSISHTMTYVEAIRATCCSTGILAHWHCSICGKDFSDKAGTIEIDNVVLPIDPSNHVGETEIRDAMEATYTHDGYTGDTYCLSCNKKIASGSMIPKKDPGSESSSGGGSSVSTYTIKFGDIDNGNITANYRQAEKGTIVTLTLSPNDGYELKSLTVLDKNNKEIKVKKVNDAEYTFEMPQSAVTVEAVFALAAGEAGLLLFTDVAEGSWYYDAVRYVYKNGLMAGTGNTKFEPDLTTSRGMIVTILYRMEGTPSVPGGYGFTDVEADQWYSDAIAWAAANNIVGGYGNGLFGPDDPITREQLAAILYRYAQYKGYDTNASANLSQYTDLEQFSEWAQEAVAWANGEGIINGTSVATLYPKGSATRAQVAAMLMRFCENITV